MTKFKITRGSTLVEVLVVAGVLASIALAVFGTLALLSRFHEKNMSAIKAQLLAEEGIEALRFIKASGWSTLSGIPSGTARYLALSPSSWGVTTTPEIVDGEFWRVVKVYAVSRNVSGDIVSSGGTIDPNTLLLESNVSWVWRGATSTTGYQSYITNL
jgi:type II secretory pathway pseudopilin PulG